MQWPKIIPKGIVYDKPMWKFSPMMGLKFH